MNHLQRKTGQFLSESFSGDVLHPILSSPTDTLQALNEAFDATKVAKITQSTKNKLKKFLNGDFFIDYNGNFSQIRRYLRKLLTMNMSGATDYSVYNTPKGRFALRIADHNASGNNFEQDDANINISIYVAFREFNVPNSKVKYTEYKIQPDIYNKDKLKVIESIINAVAQTLYGEDFVLDKSIAERQDYPITKLKTENSSLHTMTYNEKKTLYENMMYEIAKIVKTRINQLD